MTANDATRNKNLDSYFSFLKAKKAENNNEGFDNLQIILLIHVYTLDFATATSIKSKYSCYHGGHLKNENKIEIDYLFDKVNDSDN